MGRAFEQFLKVALTGALLMLVAAGSSLGNQPPVFVDAPLIVTGDHCNLLETQFHATDNDGPQQLTYFILSGVGSIDCTTGHWTYTPSISDISVYRRSIVAVSDGIDTTRWYLDVYATNVAPIITAGCNAIDTVYRGETGTLDLDAVSPDCDMTITWSLGSVNPAPNGSIAIDSNGTITFNTVLSDGGFNYEVLVVASDQSGASDTCLVVFEVYQSKPFDVRIEKRENVQQGEHVYVDVTLEDGTQSMGGFDLIISYEANALQFIGASLPDSSFYHQCEWEYFTYRYSTFGECANACAGAKLRFVQIAETNNGSHHPTCFLPELPSLLFTIDFLVSDNRTYECTWLPIRFVWFDCYDNAFSNVLGDTIYVSRRVFGEDTLHSIADSIPNEYPTWLGAQLCESDDPRYPGPVRFADFHNGGVYTACLGIDDIYGDLNLNEIFFEIADAVLFANYFVYGPAVFNIDVDAQTKTSDVNRDGVVLDVADLVYLIRIEIGEATPHPKGPPPTIDARYHVMADGALAVSTDLAAAAIVVSGDARPTLLADQMNMISNFDGVNTRILVFTDVNRGEIETFSASFIHIGNHDIISANFASPLGGRVNATEACCVGLRGNVNDWGEMDVVDLLSIAYYLFQDEPLAACLESADVNNNASVDILDLDYLVNYMFRGGPTPAICP